MKLHILFLALVFQTALFPNVFGQTKSTSNAHLTRQYSNFDIQNSKLNYRNFFEAMADQLQLAQQTEMVLTEAVPGENGFVHYKFQQLHDGLPVFGGTYILHEKNGFVERATGHLCPKISLNTKPSMNAASALNFAKQAMKANEYAEEQAKPVLCLVDRAFPKISERVNLAYQVDLESTEPFDKRRFFVDAHSGKVIGQFPLILQEGVPSTAKTRYYGTKNIITDSLGPSNFKLHDPTRGEGITVFRTDLTNFTNTSSSWDLTNSSQDEVALDAHYCSQEYYDMMKGAFEWEGLDGAGKALNVLVHNNGAGEVNAFWDGENTNFGDGNCAYGPLTTLEVVGHEFTHGMIDHTSKLVYAGESGAINESLADMFGKMLERKADPSNFNWDLGHSFLLTPDAKPFRVMDDPASVGMPDLYKGSLWMDFADVHTNSSIGNLWFSMIVDGKQGTNEAGYTYNVPALGMDKAGQIVFLTNRAYLTENADYQAFYDYSMQATAELFGDGSAEQLAVEEAWNAVGLPTLASQVLDLGMSAAYVVNELCVLNEYLPISFDVVNQGGLPYEPSMNAVVTLVDLDGTLNDFSIEINEPIAPGEKISFTVDDWFIASEGGLYFTNIELTFNDEDPTNNYAWEAYDIAEFSADDLSLNAYVSTADCFDNSPEFLFNLRSKSCETIPAGTSLDISAETEAGTIIWSMTHVLTEDLNGFERQFFSGNVDLSDALPDEELLFKLDYSNDPNLENNDDAIAYPLLNVIAGDYLNNFSTDISLEQTLQVGTILFEPTIDFQAERYFGSTGALDDPDALTHCPDYLSNFNNGSYYGVNTTIKACVDFSASQNPYLEFDLMLFKNNFATAENYPYSSMLQAKWEGNEDGSIAIHDQEEGELVHHGYQLPSNFKGEILFKLYTELGQWELNTDNFNNDDVVLLDNLQFHTSFTKTEETKEFSTISIAPNPTNNIISIQSNELIKALILRDISGQLIREITVNAPDFDLDLGGQPEGFYLLNVQLDNGQWSVEKVVKL